MNPKEAIRAITWAATALGEDILDSRLFFGGRRRMRLISDLRAKIEAEEELSDADRERIAQLSPQSQNEVWLVLGLCGLLGEFERTKRDITKRFGVEEQ